MPGIVVFILFSAVLVQAQIASDIGRWQSEAERGDATAQFWLGAAYEGGKGVTHDFAQARRWLAESAKQDNADAANLLGQMHENAEGVPLDYAQAAKFYRAACQHRPDYGGATQGCNNLGLLYLAGRGVKQSNVEAYMFFKVSHTPENLAIAKACMSANEVSEAERRAMQWIHTHPDR
jgi:TPR repeat protein